MVKYAVVFKTHFWDEFAERQFERLRSRAGCNDIFIVIDETKQPVRGVMHDKIIRMTEQQLHDEGYLCYPRGNVFWYNTDYQIYRFFSQYPEFDYIFISEYDCVVNVDIRDIISYMQSNNLDFVGEPIRVPSDMWHWAKMARSYYEKDLKITGRLVCCAALSKNFALCLEEARKLHTQKYLDRSASSPRINTNCWPNNEAFIGAEIARLSIAEAPLSTFGDVSYYDWAPAHPETALDKLEIYGFIHPVLDVERFIRSVFKTKNSIQDLFDGKSAIRDRLIDVSHHDIVSALIAIISQAKSWDLLNDLKSFSEDKLGSEWLKYFNVAKNKPASQSSICKYSKWPSVFKDASGAVNGSPADLFGFHTDLQHNPWWMVDLGACYPVREIRIYNRHDLPDRSKNLIVSFSSNCIDWEVLHECKGKVFGQKRLSYLLVQSDPPREMRFVRISLPEMQILHLAEVEVYI